MQFLKNNFFEIVAPLSQLIVLGCGIVFIFQTFGWAMAAIAFFILVISSIFTRDYIEIEIVDEDHDDEDFV